MPTGINTLTRDYNLTVLSAKHKMTMFASTPANINVNMLIGQQMSTPHTVIHCQLSTLISC